MANRSCIRAASALSRPLLFASGVTKLAPARFAAAPALSRGMIDNSKPPTQLKEPVAQDKCKVSGEQLEVKHDMVHFKASQNVHPLGVQKLHDIHGQDYKIHNVPHPIWSKEEIDSVQQTHLRPGGITDTIALYAIKFLRASFDTLSFYNFGKLTTGKVVNRAIFLETVAGVPGMTAGMLRHLRSLRRMDRDHGWIHTLLEEAENERMHLLTFIKLKQPGPVFRAAVVVTQGLFMPAFFLAYFVHPHICHRFVGYLEEEAVHTYTGILEAIDDGRLGEWQTAPAPAIGIDYWQLGKDATMRDLILAVRADEANHRDVNHTFASLKLDEEAPFDEDGRPVYKT
mmetsp:Transcript_55326/g.135505  ORF Transcript_55326/g.135505 Transcript_55326/m.135505 type:complete len:342 (-) Transcript_55326:285-1310(-)